MRIPADDLYALLDVRVDADELTIRKAYRCRIRQLHPDLQPEDRRAQAHEQTAKVTLAREILCDPVKRREYDASRRPTDMPPRRTAPPPPPPRPTPEPPRPRSVITIPDAIEFGVVSAGHKLERQIVWLRFRNGARVRTVRLAREMGRFWQATVDWRDDGYTVRILFDGRTSPTAKPPGRLVDELRVEIDEVGVDIPLGVTVEAASPRPAPAAPPQPEPRYAAQRRFRMRQAIAAGLAVILAVVFVAYLLVGQLGGHGHNHTVATPTVATPRVSTLKVSTSEFCSVSRDKSSGMLTFYRTKTGTNQEANDDPVWSIMVPR